MTKTKKVLLWSLIVFFAVLLLSAGALFSYQQAFAGKVYKNVYFAESDLSGKTKKEVSSMMQTKFNNLLSREIVLASGDKEVKAKLQDTGIQYDISQIINESYTIGREGNFVKNLLYSSRTIIEKREIKIKPIINEAQYNEFIKIAVEQLNVTASDASIAIEKGELKFTESIDGKIVDTTNLASDILNLSDNQTNRIELASTILPAKIKNADFEQAKTSASDYLNKKISLTYADKNFSPTKAEIGAWIKFGVNDGKYYAFLEDTNIRAYLIKIGQNFTKTKKDRKVDANSGATLEEGQAGLYVDQDKTLAELKSKIGGNNIQFAITTETVQPGEIKYDPNEGLLYGRFPGKYIDVNLTTQRFCRFEGNTLIDCLGTSTGKPSMPTPTGSFAITFKEPMRFSYMFPAWMPWWQQFNGPYGIHELVTFPNGVKEDDDHIGQAVSHGCVRLSRTMAKVVYDWTEIGTQVYIHK